MHRMLAVPRLEEGVPAERQPQPGVRELGALIDRTPGRGSRLDEHIVEALRAGASGLIRAY